MWRVTTYKSRGKEYPQIQLRGAWLHDYGLSIGDRIGVSGNNSGILIQPVHSSSIQSPPSIREARALSPVAEYPSLVRLCLLHSIGKPDHSHTISGPEDASYLFKPMQDLDRETFWTLYLDSQHRVTGIEEVAIGTLNAAIVHPREVYKGPLLANAASIVVGHNHPSGDLEPSQDDLRLTDRLYDVGEMIGIHLLDHLIVGGGNYNSLREHLNVYNGK